MPQRYFFLILLGSGRTVNLRVALRANLVVSGHLSWNRIILREFPEICSFVDSLMQSVLYLDLVQAFDRILLIGEDNDISNSNCTVHGFESNYLDLEIKNRTFGR